ncbi:MAG: M23 family metallopeptidase [Microbacterium sp.]|uniref:M23 family metallopeptidase n=1 Tax=Microbacterium sp. TaxID=51671 RepID=UPI00262EDC72|nr:M23 family metallopeptidase [Microbacterium sp.]MCX6502674.1 M23 family metallopeptidase [Microbacterium sp.]
MRRSRRPSAHAVDVQQVSDDQTGVMDAAAPAAPADVLAPTVPLTRRQLRELAAKDAAFVTINDVPGTSEPAGTAVTVETVEPVGEVDATLAELDAAEVDAAEEIPEVEFVEAVRADGRTVVDEFEAAARLFSFTGETPIQVAAAAILEDEPAEDSASAPHAATQPKRGRLLGRGAAFKRVTAASATIGAMGIVGLLAVGMTTPAEAVAAASGTTALGTVSLASDVAASGTDEIQAYVAPATATTASLDRSDYATATTASLASEVGITNYSTFFSNNPNAAIQWPFAVGVPITYGYGWRSGALHEGADFTPGQGAHVQAIAAGTVRIATESGGAFGVTVLIDHIIDGKLVSTRYGHMLYGSLQVSVGDTVVAGQYLGRTGNTGRSFGAHTHVEVLANGTTAIDPIEWLRENAGRMSLDGE